MNKYQFRAIRNSFQRDIMFVNDSGYGGEGIIDNPIMRKTINDVTIKGKRLTNKTLFHSYTLWKGKNVYKEYTITTNRSSNIYIITLNDKIIYWTPSPIYAPAFAAWHVLTEVYHGYRKNTGCQQWKSASDFDCINHFWDRHSNWEEYDYYHTDYQRDMYKKHKHFYVDKCIITQEEADILAGEEYYHI